MANKTNNYKFPKPEADDFYDISEYNKAMDILDDSLTEMNQKKLDKNGDASEAVTEFEQEILRENIESGETLSVIHGKVKKWFSEMKDVVFSGHAKDVTTDAAHRFVSDTEKSSWNGKVGASGGDISETVIETLEPIDTKFPVPVSGEMAKVFMGKVKKYINDTKPLDKNTAVFVATTGSNILGDGTSSKPYKSIQYAIDTLPKDLGTYDVNIRVADGTYNEVLDIKSFTNGRLSITRETDWTSLNTKCTVLGANCINLSAAVILAGINFTRTDTNVIISTNCTNITLWFCQSLNIAQNAFAVFYTCTGVVDSCKCVGKKWGVIAETCSHISSRYWASGSSATDNGNAALSGSIIHTAGNQPSGLWQYYTLNGGSIVHDNGTQITDMISSGLSCTWGTLSDGYYRHGNINGTAVIIINIRVAITTELSAWSDNYILGFPIPVTAQYIGVSSNVSSHFYSCTIDNTGKMRLTTMEKLVVGNVYYFSATYVTNS